MKRVVITGIGIYSCIGKNLEEVKESLQVGKSGIILDPERKEMGYRSGLTGYVEEPNLKKELGRRQRVGLSEEAKYAYVATKEALEYAKLDQDYIDQHEVGILYGNDSSAGAVTNAVDVIREKKDTSLVGSGSIFQSMNCTITMNLSTIFKLKGINFTISAACASGSHSIGMAYFLIQNGWQDIVVTGGGQEINKYAFGNFDGLGAFSTFESDPTKASRPFDKNRDGLIPSGGAATVIVESYESAIKRGAPILAEIKGYGFSSNGEHISNPNKDGQIRSLNKAIEQSKLKISDFDYINAHATSTPVGDSYEAQALSEIFGKNVPVSSTKSMTGHECWMAGASEIVYSILMMQNDFIAPNINFETPDDSSKELDIVTEKVDKKLDCILSNSFGFGGTNSTLIIKRVD